MFKDQKRVFVLLVLMVLLVLAAALYLKSANNKETSEKNIVAYAGGLAIADEDLKYSAGVKRAYGDNLSDRAAISVGLISQEIDLAIAGRLGVMPTKEEIISLDNHVDTTTKAPEILEKVKAVFGNDKESYLRLYIQPIVISEKLRAYWSRSPEIHAQERAIIEKAYDRTVSGENIKKTAAELGLAYATSTISKAPETPPDALKKFDLAAGISPLVNILEKLKPGEVNKTIVEDDIEYSVIRLIRESSKDYFVESAAAIKSSYDDWYKKEAEKIKVKIIDKSLQKEISGKYPDWIKKINLAN